MCNWPQFYDLFVYCITSLTGTCALLFSAEESTYPGFEGNQFQDHLHCEESSEEHVEDVHGIVEAFGLSVMLRKTHTTNTSYWCAEHFTAWTCNLPLFRLCSAHQAHLHGQTDGVEKDEGEHQVLKVGGVDHVPHLVLVRVLGDVATQWSRF